MFALRAVVAILLFLSMPIEAFGQGRERKSVPGPGLGVDKAPLQQQEVPQAVTEDERHQVALIERTAKNFNEEAARYGVDQSRIDFLKTQSEGLVASAMQLVGDQATCQGLARLLNAVEQEYDRVLRTQAPSPIRDRRLRELGEEITRRSQQERLCFLNLERAEINVLESIRIVSVAQAEIEDLLVRQGRTATALQLLRLEYSRAVRVYEHMIRLRSEPQAKR